MQRRPFVALLATVAVLGAVVVVFAVTPRLRYWNCRDAHERAAIHEAIDAYYRNCWIRPADSQPPAAARS